jgi:beta-lactamase regulating signal transducer with metallopeptidase domain
MSHLIELTLRGSAAVLIVLIFDLSLAARISGPSRRFWWCFVPIAFLLPLRIPVPQALAHGLAPAAAWARLPPELSAGIIAAEKSGSGHAVLLFGIWMTGVVVYIAVVGIQTFRASRRWSYERLSTDRLLLELLEDCKAKAGVTASIGLVVADTVSSPAIMGWLRPRILLPASLVNAGSTGGLRPILLHELAHYRWYDVPFHWALTLVRAIHWFNPFAHIGAISWGHFCEEAADEAAIKWMRAESGQAYGDTLVRTLRETRGAVAPFGALAMGESFRCLKRRMKLINRYQQKSPSVMLAGLGAILLTASVAAVPSWVEIRPALNLQHTAVAEVPVARLNSSHAQIVVSPANGGGRFVIVMPPER